MSNDEREVCRDLTCRRRRASDRKAAEQIRHILMDGDISMLCLMGGLGLILWAFFGLFMFMDNLKAYLTLFPYGDGGFWVANYISCGLAMWYLVSKQFPPLLSLLVGSWISVIWVWSALARMATTATYQTDKATSIVYILIGILIVHRSARR